MGMALATQSAGRQRASTLPSASGISCPERAQKARPELLEQFTALLKGQSATVNTLEGPDQVPAAVARYLVENNLPARARMGVDPWLTALPWDAVAGLTILRGRAEANDEVGISRAKAGVSETGTLMLVSGASNPVTLAFVPETHIIIVAEDDIGGSLEDGIRSHPRAARRTRDAANAELDLRSVAHG